MTKKIYFDACCFNRPFDDQNQDKVRIETESIIILLSNIRNGTIKLIGSDVLLLEIDKTLDPVKKSQLKSLTNYISKYVRVDQGTKDRANEIQNLGFKGFDSFHIACAEKGNVDTLLTTDSKMIKLYLRNENKIFVKIKNPIDFLQELLII